MSEALAVDLTQFDDSPRPGPEPDGQAPARIGRALGDAGIHVPSTLYNEALALAREGHLGQAQARLQMLVCLDPDDGEALLLLAKVHANQGRWTEALARLDAAITAGIVAPAGLREGLEGQIRAERLREEEHRARVAARELSELKALRHETRALRGETIRLEAEVGEGKEREKAWKFVAVAAGVFGTAVILFLMLTTPRTPSAEVPVPKPDDAAVAAAPELPPVGYVPSAGLEPAPAPAAAAVAGARVHVVKKGDTLGGLAAKYYGKTSQWPKILAANPQLGPEGKKLALGMELSIPE